MLVRRRQRRGALPDPLSNRAELRELITAQTVDLVAFEACTLAGWVFDLCRELRVKAQVANTNAEAWKWKNVKRKTRRS